MPEDQSEAPANFRRQVVDYRTHEAPGTIIIDTSNTHLYFVLGNGKAVRYGIGVGREGFTWSGTRTVSRKAEWPDWTPPAEMIARQPYLPRYMAGGPGNPLGARALLDQPHLPGGDRRARRPGGVVRALPRAVQPHRSRPRGAAGGTLPRS